VTANQVVAYNLRRARGLRGWTQLETSERLEPLLGKRWSKATFSIAERSIAGRRIKKFSADEIAAFVQVFRLPVAYFFLAPEDESARERLIAP
jgi:transcriptional regulator with XRE-family HTH domain